MSTRKHGGADGQSYIFKIATVIILVLTFGALFLIQKEMRKAGGTAQAYVQPMEKSSFKAAKGPMRTGLPTSTVPPMTPEAMRKAGGTTQTYVQPMENDTFKAARESMQTRVPAPTVSPMTPDAQPKIAAPPPRAATPSALPTFTQAPVRSAAPPPPRNSQPGAQMQPAPVTEVHPLSDAEEVMGAPSSELGEVGVTRTYKLPEQEEQNETLPPPNE